MSRILYGIFLFLFIFSGGQLNCTLETLGPRVETLEIPTMVSGTSRENNKITLFSAKMIFPQAPDEFRFILLEEEPFSQEHCRYFSAFELAITDEQFGQKVFSYLALDDGLNDGSCNPKLTFTILPPPSPNFQLDLRGVLSGNIPDREEIPMDFQIQAGIIGSSSKGISQDYLYSCPIVHVFFEELVIWNSWIPEADTNYLVDSAEKAIFTSAEVSSLTVWGCYHDFLRLVVQFNSEGSDNPQECLNFTMMDLIPYQEDKSLNQNIYVWLTTYSIYQKYDIEAILNPSCSRAGIDYFRIEYQCWSLSDSEFLTNSMNSVGKFSLSK